MTSSFQLCRVKLTSRVQCIVLSPKSRINFNNGQVNKLRRTCSSRVKTNSQLQRAKSTIRVQRAVFAPSSVLTPTNQADVSRSTYSSRVKASKSSHASKSGNVFTHFWKGEVGSRFSSKKQEARSKKQEKRSKKQEARSRMQEAGNTSTRRSTNKNEAWSMRRSLHTGRCGIGPGRTSRKPKPPPQSHHGVMSRAHAARI